MTTSKVYLLGDPNPLYIGTAPDATVTALEHAQRVGQPFLRINQIPLPGQRARPLYLRPNAVAAVLPLSPSEVAQLERELEQYGEG